MAKKSLRSGSGIVVPEGMGGALDIGGIGIATHIHSDRRHDQAIRDARRRIKTVTCVFALCFFVLGARLVAVMLLPGDGGKNVSGLASVETRVRGDLVDRNGELLATNLTSLSLYADTREVWNPGVTTAALMEVLPDLDEMGVLAKLTSGSHSVQLMRYLTPIQKQMVFDLGLAGLSFPHVARRIYPRDNDAAHVLGYVDADNKGISGIEQSLNEIIVQAGLGGGVVTLSLDMRVQHVVQDELARAIDKFSSIGGAGLVLDVRTGEVLALSSQPDFNPNGAQKVDENTHFNRITKGNYEMGSVFKMFTLAMALDAGVVTMNDGYDASRPMLIGGRQINDYHGKNRRLSVPEIFAYSSNIGTVKIARDVGIPRHQAFLRSLGLNQPVPIELTEVSMPRVPSQWREIRAATISYGHGISVSPLHLARAAAALVNGGLLVEPTILKREASPDTPAVRVISKATSEQMRQLLRLVVTDGTARQADVEGYFVGGKTGTADKYNSQARLNTFVATFPIQDPQYVVLMMLDEPKGIEETFGFATAGWTTAPLARDVISRIGPLLGVLPQKWPPDRYQQASLILP